MNIIIQNILTISTIVLATAFLVKKFFWKKKQAKKACGGGHDNCGCH